MGHTLQKNIFIKSMIEPCLKFSWFHVDVFTTKKRDEWLKIMKKERDLIITPVNSISDLPNDTQVTANEYIADFEHPTLGPIKVVGVPVKLSKTPGSIRLPAPEFGQHTEEVLIDLLDYSWEDIAKLKDDEVI